MRPIKVIDVTVPLSLLIFTSCVTPPPHVAPPAGIYQCPQTITMTDSAAGAFVFYTEDGSAPTTQSKKYTTAFATSAQSVQAIAQARSGKVSKVSAVTYACALTRGEFAVLLQQQYSLPTPNRLVVVADVAPSDPIFTAVQAAESYMNPQILCPTCALSKNFYPNQPVTQATTTLALVRVMVSQGKLKLLAPAEADKTLSKMSDAHALPSIAARQYFATAMAHNLISLSPAGEIQVRLMRSRADVESLMERVHTEFDVRKPQ